MEGLLLITVVWFVCGIAAAAVAANRGRSGCGGLLLGVMLGPIGLAIVLLMQPADGAMTERAVQRGQKVPCPHCANPINPDARRCQHCHANLADEERDDMQTTARARTQARARETAFVVVLVVIIAAVALAS